MNPNLTIEQHNINQNTDCYVIAEIGCNHQGDIEKAEGIEMLRYLENGIQIGCIEIKGGSQTVDHKEDIKKIEMMMRKG